MDYRKKLVVEPGTRVKLSKIDPGYKGKEACEKEALAEIQQHLEKLRKLQFLLYAEKKHSLLIVLQALDAAGKDGTVNHVLSAMNPQGTTVVGFKKPTEADLNHDFLWRIHPHTPCKGGVAIFNRSYYEDVLVVRVHKLAPRKSGRSATSSSTILRSSYATRAILTLSNSFCTSAGKSNWSASSSG